MSGERASRRRAVLLLPAALAGCKLIDQTTFRPVKKPPPPPPPAPPGPPPVPPLLSIRSSRPGIDYAGALRDAVQAARSRKPDVHFDVQSLAPAGPTIDAQLAALQEANRRAGEVGAAIVRLGVAPGQVSLSARVESGIAVPEIRVYVH